MGVQLRILVVLPIVENMEPQVDYEGPELLLGLLEELELLLGLLLELELLLVLHRELELPVFGWQGLSFSIQPGLLLV